MECFTALKRVRYRYMMKLSGLGNIHSVGEAGYHSPYIVGRNLFIQSRGKLEPLVVDVLVPAVMFILSLPLCSSLSLSLLTWLMALVHTGSGGIAQKPTCF